MPYAKIGDKTPLDGGSGKLFKLSSKGQKVLIRILGDGYYNGKHFLQKNDSSWNVFHCPRVMLEKPCMYCERFFEKSKELKELKKVKAKDRDNEAIESVTKEIRRFRPTIKWHYPALNRDDGKPIILQVSMGVRNKLEEFVEAGIDILDSDFVLTRKEELNDYYPLTRKDSKETPKLTEEEVSSCTEALSWDIQKEVEGRKSSLTFVPENEESEA